MEALEGYQNSNRLQSEITSTVIAIINGHTFAVQLFFGRVGFTGTSFETLPTAAGVALALAQYDEDRKSQLRVASRQQWETSVAVRPPADTGRNC